MYDRRREGAHHLLCFITPTHVAGQCEEYMEKDRDVIMLNSALTFHQVGELQGKKCV